MPGTNLTRDEAATRAALLDVTSYSIDLDLTTGDTTFGSTTTIRFTCTEPGAETFADLVGATIHEITLNGASVDPATAYADSRIALTGLAADNELVVRADCTYSRTGEGLHRFVDPADDRVYLYSQFEVPDARRVYTTFEQPDLKAPFTFTVTAPSHWKVVSNSPSPEPEVSGDKGVWRFAPTKPMSTYITAVVAGEYHEVQHVYDGKHGDIPLGHYCRQSLVEHLDVDELVKLTEQGFAFFEERLRLPVPVRQVRPALRAGVQHGRDGERRLRDAARRVPPPQPPGPLVLRVPRRGDPPRDGAHVVRRPGDHEVVGRPLAQRVVRRVGLLPRRRPRRPSSPRPGPASPTPARTGLPPGPAAEHPPDRGRQRRPARGRGELRRHHLRQGRLGAQAARRLGRPRQLPRGRPRLLQGLRVLQHRVRRPARRAREVLGPRPRVLGPGVAADLGREHPRRPSSSWTPTATTRRSPCARPPPPTTRRCAGTGSASACTTRSTATWSAVPRSRSTSTAS